jgi:hypothetical protein
VRGVSHGANAQRPVVIGEALPAQLGTAPGGRLAPHVRAPAVLLDGELALGTLLDFCQAENLRRLFLVVCRGIVCVELSARAAFVTENRAFTIVRLLA